MPYFLFFSEARNVHDWQQPRDHKSHLITSAARKPIAHFGIFGFAQYLKQVYDAAKHEVNPTSKSAPRGVFSAWKYVAT